MKDCVEVFGNSGSVPRYRVRIHDERQHLRIAEVLSALSTYPRMPRHVDDSDVLGGREGDGGRVGLERCEGGEGVGVGETGEDGCFARVHGAGEEEGVAPGFGLFASEEY